MIARKSGPKCDFWLQKNNCMIFFFLKDNNNKKNNWKKTKTFWHFSAKTPPEQNKSIVTAFTLMFINKILTAWEKKNVFGFPKVCFCLLTEWLMINVWCWIYSLLHIKLIKTSLTPHFTKTQLNNSIRDHIIDERLKTCWLVACLYWFCSINENDFFLSNGQQTPHPRSIT